MRTSADERPRTVDEYFERLPPESREILAHLRETIRSAAPRAKEVISYGIPAFREHGLLVYYAAFEDHFSFFPGSAGVRHEFARELRPFTGGKGTVRFTREKPLPDALVTRMVRARVAEDERKAASSRPKGRKPKKKPR